jgi:nitrilase
LRARTIETQCYVAAAAQWGVHAGGRRTFGGSAIVDPWGQVLAERAEGEGVATGAIHRARLAQVREMLPSRKHRRLR